MRRGLAQIRAIAAQDFRFLVLDPLVVIIVVLMPLVVSVFLSPLFEVALQDQGFETTSGAEQSIPAVAVLFSFFLVTFAGYSVFREHGWNTWDRLRSLRVPKWVLLAGKGLPPLGVLLLQQLIVFAIGAAGFRIDVVEHALALAAVAVCFGASLIGLALMLVTLLRSVHQIGAVGNLMSIVLGGLGGAIAPVALLPRPIQAVGRAAPSYWAIEGYRDVLLTDAGVGDVLGNCAVLLTMAVATLAVAAWRFDVSEKKVSWV